MFNPLHSILSFSFLRFPIIWHFLHATGFKISIWYVFIHFGRLRTIRYSNGHRTFELRSCPHGFKSLSDLCTQTERTHLTMSAFRLWTMTFSNPRGSGSPFFEQVAEPASSKRSTIKKSLFFFQIPCIYFTTLHKVFQSISPDFWFLIFL